MYREIKAARPFPGDRAGEVEEAEARRWRRRGTEAGGARLLFPSRCAKMCTFSDG